MINLIRTDGQTIENVFQWQFKENCPILQTLWGLLKIVYHHNPQNILMYQNRELLSLLHLHVSTHLIFKFKYGKIFFFDAISLGGALPKIVINLPRTIVQWLSIFFGTDRQTDKHTDRHRSSYLSL